MKRYDTVKLAQDLPEHGLAKGLVGCVVDVHEQPQRAYEVEFVDERGATTALIALDENQLELVLVH